MEVDDDNNYVKVMFTPTIPHCSMATLIGLAIRVMLLRSLPDRFKVCRNHSSYMRKKGAILTKVPYVPFSHMVVPYIKQF